MFISPRDFGNAPISTPIPRTILATRQFRQTKNLSQSEKDLINPNSHAIRHALILFSAPNFSVIILV